MVQGAYRQWLVDNHPEMLELKAIDIIARHTLGHKKRYGYVKQDLFNMSQSKINRQVQKAKKFGLLEYTRTRQYTMYRLILPSDIENNTIWRRGGSKIKETQQTEIKEGF